MTPSPAQKIFSSLTRPIPRHVHSVEQGRALAKRLKQFAFTGPGVLEIPPGIIPIEETLVIPTNVTIQGTGAPHSPYGSSLMMIGGERDVIRIEQGHCAVRNLAISRDTKLASETTGNGIAIGPGGSMVHLENLWIERQRIGIFNDGLAADGPRSIFLHIVRCIGNDVARAHIWHRGGIEMFMSESYFLASRADGIICTDGAAGIYWERSMVYGCTGAGLILDSGSNNGWIRNSCFDMCQGHNAHLRDVFGLELSGGWHGGAGYTIPIVDEWGHGWHATAQDPKSESCGVYLENCEDIGIIGNRIYIPAYRGIRASAGEELRINSNSILGCGNRAPGKKTGVAIEVEGIGGPVEIVGNRGFDTRRFGLNNTGAMIRATGKRTRLFMASNNGPVVENTCKVPKGKFKQAASLCVG